MAPAVASALVDSTTKMSRATVVVTTSVSAAYAKKYSNDVVVPTLQDKHGVQLLNAWSLSHMFREHAYGAPDDTVVVQNFTIWPGERLPSWMKTRLEGYVDQSAWRRMPWMANLSREIDKMAPPSIAGPESGTQRADCSQRLGSKLMIESDETYLSRTNYSAW